MSSVPSALGRETERSLLKDQGSANVPASLLVRLITFHALVLGPARA
jgi:hypothetical protein